MQHRRRIGENEGADDEAGALLRQAQQGRQDQLLGLALQHFEHRDALDPLFVEHFLENRRLLMPSRIHIPIATMTMLIRNGMRQPQTLNWSPDR